MKSIGFCELADLIQDDEHYRFLGEVMRGVLYKKIAMFWWDWANRESEWRERRGIGSETKIVETLRKIVFCFVFVRVAVGSETNRPSRVSSKIPCNPFSYLILFSVFHFIMSLMSNNSSRIKEEKQFIRELIFCHNWRVNLKDSFYNYI